jgi:hypothetical protein
MRRRPPTAVEKNKLLTKASVSEIFTDESTLASTNGSPFHHHGTIVPKERFVPDSRNVFVKEINMIYRATAAVFAGLLIAGAAAAQTAAPSGGKPETSCTTTGAATSASGDEKTSNSMAMEKSAVLPDAGGHANSAAPTVQSGGKPLEVHSECPPDSKPKG